MICFHTFPVCPKYEIITDDGRLLKGQGVFDLNLSGQSFGQGDGDKVTASNGNL